MRFMYYMDYFFMRDDQSVHAGKETNFYDQDKQVDTIPSSLEAMPEVVSDLFRTRFWFGCGPLRKTRIHSPARQLRHNSEGSYM